MIESRSSSRRRVFIGGRIALNRYSTFDCVVKNLSRTGARITFSQGQLIPQRFDIAMTGGVGRRFAEVVWMRDGEAGLAFQS
jgi:hypothetical protein